MTSKLPDNRPKQINPDKDLKKLSIAIVGVILVALWWIADISRRQQDALNLQEMKKYCATAPDPSLDETYYKRCLELMNN